MCEVPASKLWTKAFPQKEFPFHYSNTQMSPTIPLEVKGFLFFSIIHSHVQLKRKGNLDRNDKNFYPSFAIGQGKMQDVALYFSKFVIFFLSHRCANGATLAGVSNLTFPRHLIKTIKDNSSMTDSLYDHLNDLSNQDFANFWSNAKKMEGTDRYFELLFKFSKDLIQ
jgi:hypothetical protein